MRNLLLALSLSALSLSALSGCSPNSNPAIPPLMQRMNTEYRAAQAATSIEEFRTHYEALRSATMDARAEMLEGRIEDAEEYTRGMNELVTVLPAVDAALARGDLPGAHSELTRMEALRRTYHTNLGL